MLLPPQDRPVHAVAVLLASPSTSTACASATTRPSTATACSTRPSTPIRDAKARGFRVTTNSTFFNTDSPKTVRDVLDFLNDELKVDAMMISPGYAYVKAPDQEHFLGVEQTRELFREAFADGRRKHWRLNHSPLFLDFLEGKVDFELHGVGHPELLGARLAAAVLPHGRRLRRRRTRSSSRPRTGRSYGRGQDPRCNNCMAHCGYEPTAVLATLRSPRQAIRALAGPR